MSRLTRGVEGVRTITFPSTVRDVKCGAFATNRQLRSAVLNEGLERLEGYRNENRNHIGVFFHSRLQRVTLRSTLKVMADGIFRGCEKLRRVTFAEDCQLGKIGRHCFSESGVIEISIPSSITVIEMCAFCACRNLKRVTIAEDS